MATWAASPFRQGLKLELFGSGRLLWWFMVIGIALVIASASCYRQESLRAESLRWLFLLSSAFLSSGVCIIVVELLAPQIEVHFFQALMVMPSSWGLYKFWLWTGTLYCTFQALWSWTELGLGPDDQMSRVAGKVEDIINVVALFTTVSLILVVLSKAIVSSLYSEKHSHKVLSALRQESILADLAACHAPLRKTEELPTELETDEVPSHLVTGNLNPRASGVDITGSRAASGYNTGFARPSEDRTSAGIRQAAKVYAPQNTSSVLLADGLTSTAPTVAPGLGLPRSRLQHMNTSSLQTPGALQSVESMRCRRGTGAGAGDVLLFDPHTGHSTHVVHHRASEVVGNSTGGVSQCDSLLQQQLRRRTSQSKDGGTRGSSPQSSIGRASYDLTHALLAQQQPQSTQGRISITGYGSIPEQAVAELQFLDESGTQSIVGSPPRESLHPPIPMPATLRPADSSTGAAGSPGTDPGPSSTRPTRNGATAGSASRVDASRVDASRVDSMASVSVTPLGVLPPVLTHPGSAGPAPAALTRVRSLDSNLLTPLSDRHDKAEIGVLIDPALKAELHQGSVFHQPAAGRMRGCWACVRGIPRWVAQACQVVVAWLRDWVEEKRQELTRLRYLVSLQDAATVHIRRTLVQALYLQYKLSSSSGPKATAMEAAAAAALRAAHINQVAAPPGVDSMRMVNKSQGVRASQSAPVLAAAGQTSPGASTHSAPPDAHWKDQQALPPPAWIKLTSPRRLLDELLSVYGKLTDGELSNMATTYAKLVFASVCPVNSDYITRQDLLDMSIDPEGVEMVWDLFDKDGDDKVTEEELKVTAISFYQQRRNLALTMHAMRNLTLSIQVAVVLLINCVFLMVVYLAMLDVTYLFGANKTSLDFFSAYIVVVSLMFGDLIKTVLGGAIFLLAQQPFDIGEEIIVEEAPGWRYMGVIQDFNLMYIRIKRSTDGELVTMPINKITGNKFTNLTRSDWKIEQGYYVVDNSCPRAVLQKLTDTALTHIRANPQEYDAEYGFACYFHALERPNKLIIRTFHRFRFNLAAPHRRIAKARDGIVDAICRTFNDLGVKFVELRTWVPHGMDMEHAMYFPATVPPHPAMTSPHQGSEAGPLPPQEALQRYYDAYHQAHSQLAAPSTLAASTTAAAPPGAPVPQVAPATAAATVIK